MNDLDAFSYLWILWGSVTFLFLAQRPHSPRTALPPLRYFITAMGPVFAVGITLALSFLLGLTLFQAPAQAFPPWRILLVFGTVIGIALIPILFQSQLLRPLRPHSLSHFTVGIAWASCWPGVIVAAGTGNPTLLLLGAIGGLLPDTLDHWVARFLHRTDVHVVPDPIAPDAGMLACALTEAMMRCRSNQKPIHVQFYPVEIRAKQWQPYTLRLNNDESRITVSLAGTDITAPIPIPVTTDHMFTLDIYDEPVSLEIAPTSDNRIILRVLPWKRQWSHSLGMAAGLAGLAWTIWGFYAGLIVGGAYALHLLMDQLGFTGSNLCFPFKRHRTNGLQIVTPGQATGFYVSVIWVALLLTGWNWARTILPANWIPSLIPFLISAGALPIAGLIWLGNRLQPILKSRESET